MASEESLIKSLGSGFRAEARITLISNMKKVLLELMKDENMRDKFMKVRIIKYMVIESLRYN